MGDNSAAVSGDAVLLVHVCFVRHGETTANRDRILQGVSGDYPLTDRGLAQARHAGEALRGREWHLVLSSDLNRAKRTTELIIDHSSSDASTGTTRRHDIELCELLREINFGVLENLPRGTTVEEGIRVKAERLGVPAAEVSDHREPPQEVERRHAELLNLFAARARDAAAAHNSAHVSDTAPASPRRLKVLCVSHGGFIRSFVTKRVGASCESVPNCSFTEVEVGVEAGGELVSLRLHRLNDASHIPPDL